MRARKRPFGSQNESAIPACAQAAIRAGEAPGRPKPTTPSSMWSGTLPFSSPSTSTTRFAPSLRSQAPSLVT